ncbi:MAG: flagellar biosynthesis protein FlgL [Sulfurimonas sp.]|nr:flagellar biosynthesis protein FlgL [Sulfurimonas sp.]
MRVTSSMYYENLYGANGSKLNKELFDVNKQIASGLKIQYASDDVSTFIETMRLDNELTTLGQVKQSTESGYKISNQSDVILNDFSTSMDKFRTLLIQAANDSNSDVSRDAIAAELRGLEDHLMNLSNTSINGQYLFSGSAIDVKPISADGVYHGNDVPMNAFLGSNSLQQYNLTGADLFLGEETLVNREITSNVVNNNLSMQYPNFSDPTVMGTVDVPITTESTIRDLMGDNDTDASNSLLNHFYLSGTKSSGESFSEHIVMNGTQNIDSLLDEIGSAYGNQPNLNLVNVSLSKSGQIVVEDKISGSSKLEFHMVGAIDYNSNDGNDAANINDATLYATSLGEIDNLKHGESSFDSIVHGVSTVANPDLFLKSFLKSPYAKVNTYTAVQSSAEFIQVAPVASGETLTLTTSHGAGSPYSQLFNTDAQNTYDLLKTQVEADGYFTLSVNGDTLTLNPTDLGVANSVSASADLVNDVAADTTPIVTNGTFSDDIDTILYDRTMFSKNGSVLSSSTPQILVDTNAFASASTKISEVADLSQGNTGTLDGTTFSVRGKDTSGNNFDVQINFKSTANGGSTFSFDTDGDGIYDDPEYDIFNMDSTRVAVDADEMTYQQMMDVVNMVITGGFPDGGYGNSATEYDNKIKISEFKGDTYISYDGKIQFEEVGVSTTKAEMALYDLNAGNFNSSSSVMTFNSNNALTIRDPKTDFFKTIDEMIVAVENYKNYPDHTTGDMRNVGIENAIAMVDDLHEHIGRSHSMVGAQSNTLTNSLERTEILEISTMTLRSSVVDTDLAEASLLLSQLTLNYEAMQYTVGKVSRLSLVNYL